MLVRIEAGQRFDPVRPDDGEQSENAEGGEWLDQSNSGGRTIARLVGARLRVSSACDHVVTAALRRYRREPYQAVQCVTYRSTSARLDLGERVSSGRFHLRLAKPAHFDSPQLRSSHATRLTRPNSWRRRTQKLQFSAASCFVSPNPRRLSLDQIRGPTLYPIIYNHQL